MCLLILTNRAMSKDKDMYPDPEEFLPERFLERSTTSGEFPMDPRKFVFGFGRRLCPGLDFADASLFLNIATLLATTTISLPSDAEGFDLAKIVQVESRCVYVLRYSQATYSTECSI